MAHQNTGYESSRMSIQLQRLTNFLILHLRNKNWLPYPLCLPLNKLYVLEIAQHLGFTIPKTMVINRKSSIKDSDSYITKSLYDPTLSIMPNGNRFLNYTNRITPENNDCIPSSFFPSLIQEHIEKEYEIRTFFINGKLFSMGIFSQNDDRTKIDFRRYNISKPSRFTPITTPVEISDKIPMLMDKLNLNTGSLDFIKGKDSKYYFLEINPTGQFGMIDGACNYGLHKLVAEELIAMDYEK
jgi:ATP-GRASP peptide maturase of grasp-with-spasm system